LELQNEHQPPKRGAVMVGLANGVSGSRGAAVWVIVCCGRPDEPGVGAVGAVSNRGSGCGPGFVLPVLAGGELREPPASGPVVTIAALSLMVRLKAPMPTTTAAPTAAPAAFTSRPIVVRRRGRRTCAEVLTVTSSAGGLKDGIARLSLSAWGACRRCNSEVIHFSAWVSNRSLVAHNSRALPMS
jgi:hypothetical protein